MSIDADSKVEVCTCHRLGAVGVFSHKIAPKTTLSTLLNEPAVLSEWLERWPDVRARV